MNASELKAICRWLITIYLAANLAQATVTMVTNPSVDQSSNVSTSVPAADPQQGHGN